MGYDLGRFQEQIDEELICTICCGVLEEALIVSPCEHVFCKNCIEEWLLQDLSCPIDRQHVTPDDLKPVPRIYKNLLSRLLIKCDNTSLGCTVVVKFEDLRKHLEECEYDPNKPVPCGKGCGLMIPLCELRQHNCIRELKSIEQMKRDIQSLYASMKNCTAGLQLSEYNLRELRSGVNELRIDIQILESKMDNICSCIMQEGNRKSP